MGNLIELIGGGVVSVRDVDVGDALDVLGCKTFEVADLVGGFVEVLKARGDRTGVVVCGKGAVRAECLKVLLARDDVSGATVAKRPSSGILYFEVGVRR